MAGPAPEQKTKKKEQSKLDEQFAQLMQQPLSKPKVVETELKEYEKLALAQAKSPGLSWRVFLKKVLESPLPKDEDQSLEGYVKAAISSQTPIPVKKAEPESVRAIKDMVAMKTPSDAKLTKEAVADTMKLALLREAHDPRTNFRKNWCGEEKVV